MTLPYRYPVFRNTKCSECNDSTRYDKFTSVDKGGEETVDTVAVVLNHKAIERTKRLADYSMIVISKTSMFDTEVYATYHKLWRIEEFFKIIKSQPDACSIYVQKEKTIRDHFLICYIAVLLEWLLQLKVLQGCFSADEVMELACK